jgi:hypothetical protein
MGAGVWCRHATQQSWSLRVSYHAGQVRLLGGFWQCPTRRERALGPRALGLLTFTAPFNISRLPSSCFCSFGANGDDVTTHTSSRCSQPSRPFLHFPQWGCFAEPRESRTEDTDKDEARETAQNVLRYRARHRQWVAGTQKGHLEPADPGATCMCCLARRAGSTGSETRLCLEHCGPSAIDACAHLHPPVRRLVPERVKGVGCRVSGVGCR